jgi:hypothetical protein
MWKEQNSQQQQRVISFFSLSLFFCFLCEIEVTEYNWKKEEQNKKNLSRKTSRNARWLMLGGGDDDDDDDL